MIDQVAAHHDWQKPSSSNAMILLGCLRNTLRLAAGPAEVASVLRLFIKSLVWRMTGSTPAGHDEILRLRGVTHVVGLGTGELLGPQEIYWDRVYDHVPNFVPEAGWTVFDVGANSGVYTVQQANRGAHVYSFEPNTDCFRRLTKSVTANNLDARVTAANCAIGAAPGTAELLVPDGLTTMGSLRPEWTPGSNEHGLKVEVRTIDQVATMLGIKRIHLMKVDVEGLELDVLHGARETLRIIDRVVIEYHSVELGRRVIDVCAQHGLKVVHDEKMYQGDENMYLGVGRGLLFAIRPA